MRIDREQRGSTLTPEQSAALVDRCSQHLQGLAKNHISGLLEGQSYAWVARLVGDSVVVQSVSAEPRGTLRGRIAAEKPDAVGVCARWDVCLGAVWENFAVDKMGLVCVLELRDGRVYSRAYRGHGWVFGRAPEVRGSLTDAIYRGMADAWGLCVSDECVFETKLPPTRENIDSALEIASRTGHPVPEDIQEFTSAAYRAGLLDPEMDLMLLQAQGQAQDTVRPDDGGPGSALVRSMSNATLMQHAGARWAFFGLPVYELTHSFLSLLLLTDPSGVPLDMLRLPFGAFYVRLPVPFLKTRAGADITGFWLNSYIGESVKVLWLAISEVPVPHISQWVLARIPPDTKGTIGDWTLSMAEKLGGPDGQHFVLPGSKVTLTSDLTLVLLRVVVNLSLHLTERREREASCEPRPGSPRRADPRRLLPSTVVLSREIKLDRTLLEAAKAWANAQCGQRSVCREYVREVVPGHWKHQVYGTRVRLPDGSLRWGDQRRLQFIEPYVRGGGPLLQHIYKLDGKLGEKPAETNGSGQEEPK